MRLKIQEKQHPKSKGPCRICRRIMEHCNDDKEGALLQTLSRLIYLIQFVKCWQFFLEMNSKRLYRISGREKECRCLVFMSSTKREIWHFHVVVVQ